MRTELWALQNPNGTFLPSKKTDPTCPIKVALFKTKQHAKIFLKDNPVFTKVEPKKVVVKVINAS